MSQFQWALSKTAFDTIQSKRALLFQDKIHGPWENEPDLVEFESYGLKCLVVRHPEFLTLNGYVVIPRSHPLSGKHYALAGLEVHGGVTFSDNQIPILDQHNEFDGFDGWIFGFDCLHRTDTIPFQILTHMKEPPSSSYKDISFVQKECEHLAKQLKYKDTK